MDIEGTFCFDPSDGLYADHFPGSPIVPGSLIVHAFWKALAAHVNPAHVSCKADNFRFRSFVTPGRFPFRMQETARGFKCNLFAPSENELKTIVTGTLILDERVKTNPAHAFEAFREEDARDRRGKPT